MWTSEFSVPAGPGAPAAIRRAMDALEALSSEARADLRLLGCELATSRSLVGAGDVPAELALRVTRTGRCTRLEIAAPVPPPAGRRRAEGQPAREGPPLLERVCARWGMARSASETVIWFEIDDAPVAEASLCRLPALPPLALRTA